MESLIVPKLRRSAKEKTERELRNNNLEIRNKQVVARPEQRICMFFGSVLEDYIKDVISRERVDKDMNFHLNQSVSNVDSKRKSY